MKVINADISKSNTLGQIREQVQDSVRSGEPFVVTTIQTPLSLGEITGKISWSMPAVVMDGAGLFDMEREEFLLTYQMSSAEARRLADFFDSEGFRYFVNLVENNKMAIYYEDLQNEVQMEIREHLKSSRIYKNTSWPSKRDVVYFMLIDQKDRMEALCRSLMKQEWIDDYKVLLYDSDDFPGYSYLKIYHKAASVDRMLGNLSAMFDTRLVG